MAEKKKSQEKALPISEGPRVFMTLSPLSTYRLGQAVGRLFSEGITPPPARTPKAHRLEPVVRSGRTQAGGGVMALFGDLGSGKTVFAKGVADALGVKNVRQEVISPSFMIIREHQGRVPFFHVDLYRIGSDDELFQLNLEEYLYRPGVTLIEWADRALSILPCQRLEVYFEILGKRKRRITLKNQNLKIKIQNDKEAKNSKRKVQN